MSNPTSVTLEFNADITIELRPNFDYNRALDRANEAYMGSYDHAECFEDLSPVEQQEVLTHWASEEARPAVYWKDYGGNESMITIKGRPRGVASYTFYVEEEIDLDDQPGIRGEL